MSPNVAGEKDSNLALALAGGATTADAAEQFGISRRSVERRLRKPAFRRLVARYRDQMLAAALGRMTEKMTRAVDSVTRLLDSADERLQLRAARTLLSLSLRLRDAVDVGERLRAVEAELARKTREMP